MYEIKWNAICCSKEVSPILHSLFANIDILTMCQIHIKEVKKDYRTWRKVCIVPAQMLLQEEHKKGK